MESIIIYGGKPLMGQVEIQGSKNAVLPMIAAAVLVNGTVCLKGCPQISDIDDMIKLFEALGGRVVRKANRDIVLDGKDIHSVKVEREYAGKIRASILYLGAILGRMGEAMVAKPGGCVIGKRPIDQHIFQMKNLGYRVDEKSGEYYFYSEKRESNVTLQLPYSSVGVTENIILASVLGNQTVCVRNAAIEPEIRSLCLFLKKAGALIEGIGTSELMIHGVHRLKDVVFEVPADRIVAGTYAFAAMSTGGVIELCHVPVNELECVMKLLLRLGAILDIREDSLTIVAPKVCNRIGYVETGIYPGFPTDLQSPLLPVLCMADGNSVVCEKIFENRFGVVDELNKMGAKISVNGTKATVFGKSRLTGASVLAKELRGGAALIIAGLSARGESQVSGISYIERGYEDIVRDLRFLGADIEKITNGETF
ncbi:MAG: UDP-N-acetylglucosamine 1-carboxyvinyltransferase [Lachnospiraceae bacterium]|nr:UDP-N-acetylglucosamine 1-carboxyvinyltransferase [Lachnospiraceae bacterium]